jgi:hypothetical protein
MQISTHSSLTSFAGESCKECKCPGILRSRFLLAPVFALISQSASSPISPIEFMLQRIQREWSKDFIPGLNFAIGGVCESPLVTQEHERLCDYVIQ